MCWARLEVSHEPAPVIEFGMDFWGQRDAACAVQCGLEVAKESGTTRDGNAEAPEHAKQEMPVALGGAVMGW